MQSIAVLSAGFSLFRLFSLFASQQKEKIDNNKASIQKIKENPPSLRDTSFIKGGSVPFNIHYDKKNVYTIIILLWKRREK